MTIEIRDTDDARRFVVQSLWLQRVLKPSAETVRTILEWCMEISSSGRPLPPPGFVADCGHLALGAHSDADTERMQLPGVSPGLVREYEDYVLGKLYADSSFERGADALAHYGSPRDKAKGLAFLLGQMEEQTEFEGVILSPGVLRELERNEPAEVLAEGWQSLGDEVSADLTEQYGLLMERVRNTGETLAPADVFELEHKTALAGFGPRVALRQMLGAANAFSLAMPQHHVPGRSRHVAVASNILDEDTYPIGGFTSISNRGSIESLLHSQLAYMEGDEAERPDLFDIKFLRDELLYYSRDENQFFRRRRTFVFALFPSLVETRVKDAELPCQRIILTLAAVESLIEKLIEWLSEDALRFEILLPETGVLADEQELLEMVFREQMVNGTVEVTPFDLSQLVEHCDGHSRRSLCHCVTISRIDEDIETEDALMTSLAVDRSRPAVRCGLDPESVSDAPTPFVAWQDSTVELLADLA
ncbi:MAG: hypothetical protein H8E37_01175 [Planctomycetes bacterium]|nr:hypothetical protein [Planctomycetota bacterium]